MNTHHHTFFRGWGGGGGAVGAGRRWVWFSNEKFALSGSMVLWDTCK